MTADNNQASSPSNPIGTESDTSQQGWLELDQQGLGGETLKAKQWTTKRRVVDSSQHVGNIHTGTEKAVELDKSSTLTEETLQNQTPQEDKTSEEIERGDLTSQTSANTRPSTENFAQNANQATSQTAETTRQEDEQKSVVQNSGDESLVFEKHFETESDDRSSQQDQNKTSAAQQADLTQTITEFGEGSSPEPASTTEATPATSIIPGPVTSTSPQPLPEEEAIEEIEVIPVDSSASAPILNTENSHGLEDTAISIDLSSSLTDTDGSDSLSITIEGIPIGATLSAGENLGNGTWELTSDELTDLTLSPPTNSDEDFSLTITATSTESHGGATKSVSEVIDVFLEAVADAPLLATDKAQGAEDTAISLNITSALTDTDGSETLSSIIISNVPEDATLSAGSKNDDGSWTLNNDDLEGLLITPGQDNNDDFELALSVTATDSNGSTATSNIVLAVTVNDVNDAPTLTVESTKTVDEDGSTSITFTADDSDGTIVETTATAEHGTVTVNNNDTISYTPNPDYNGADTISVTTKDDDGATVTETSSITVNDVNDAPTLTVESTKTVTEDGTTSVTFSAADIDGTVTTTATAEHGTVTVNEDNTVTYVADINYNGTDTITVTATDDDGAVTTDTSSITVNDINDAPTASDQILSTNEDTVIVLTADNFGFTDVNNGQMEAVRFTSLESNGKLELDGSDMNANQEISRADIDAGKLTFTPAPDEAGNNYASFSFQVSDGEDWSNESYTTTVDVDAIADAPEITVNVGKGIPAPGQQTTITEDNANFYVFDDASSYQNDSGQLDFSEGNQGSELTWNGGNGWGVKSDGEKNKDGAKTLDGNESIGIQFDSEISTIDMSFKHLKGESTSWTAYDQDGNIVESGTITGPNHDADFTETITPASDFQYLIINGNEGASANGFYIGEAVTQGPVHTEYPVTIDISLQDNDGSESQGDTITIEGMPADAVLSNGTQNEDGTWTVSSDQLEGLTLNVPPSITDNFNLTISVTTTENDGDSSTTIQTTSVTVNPEASPADNTITATSGNDTIIGGAGDDYLDGDTGTDTVVFSGTEEEYNIVKNGDGSFIVQDKEEGRDGDDTVTDVEQFQFADHTVDAGDLTLSSKLIDGAVEGVEYTTTSGLHGFTDETGGFDFKDGDDVTFAVGGVTLGTATAEDVASGQTFLQDVADVDRTDLNDEYLENMATFLQSIDENSNAYDGIVVTDEIREALADVTIDLQTATEEEVQAVVEEIGQSYVEEDAAMDHVQDMLVDYTDLTHEEFDEHIDDDLSESNNSVSASAAITAETTDSAVQDFNDTNSTDLSLNIPSLTLPGEEGEGNSNNEETETVQVEKQETAVQDQSEVPDTTSVEGQMQTDILADDDLSHSLPSASLSNQFDQPETVANDKNDQSATDDDSAKQDENTQEQTTAQPVDADTPDSSGIVNTTDQQQKAAADVPEEQLADEELTDEEAGLSTDALSIILESESETETQQADQQDDTSLDRFAADGNAEQTEANGLDQFSANDDSAGTEEMVSVDRIDNVVEAENADQIEDAGLSADDGIQEELPQESEQVDTNIG